MKRLLRGAVTAAVLAVLATLVGMSPAQAATTAKSATPLTSYLRHCAQFGGAVGSQDGEASCLLVPESRWDQLGRICVAGGGTYTIVAPPDDTQFTRLVCRLA
jgi:hypothetical protein